MSLRSSASPLYPGNLDLTATRRRHRRRIQRPVWQRLRPYLPGYRARVVPDVEPLLGLTAESPPAPRDQFARCLAETSMRERRRHGHAVLQTIRGGKWV